MEVNEIQTLIDTAKFEEVIVASEKLTDNNLEGQLYKSIAYAWLGELHLAHKLANEVLVEGKNRNNQELEFASLSSIAHVKVQRGDADIKDALDEAYASLEQLTANNEYVLNYWAGFLHLVEGIFEFMFRPTETNEFSDYCLRVQKIANKLNWKFLKYFLKFIQSTTETMTWTVDQGIMPLQSFIDQISKYNYRLLEGYANTNIAAIYLIRGDFENFMDFSNIARKIWQEIKFAKGEIYYQGSLGLYNLNAANLEESLIYFQNGLKISNQLDIRDSLGSTYRFMGEINYRRGELKEALASYQKSLKIHQKNNDTFGMGDSYSHIGKIYQEFGDLEFALENYQKGLEKRESLNYISGIASSYDLIGNLHIEMNEFKSANEYYIKGLSIKRSLGNEFSIATTLFNQIRIYLELEPSMVSVIHNELQSINTKLENKQVDLYTKLAEALILKNSNRAMKKSQAQLILLDISKMKIIDHNLTVLALVNLTEILLWELKSSGDKEILDDIDETITKLIAIAKSQNIPSLFVRTYLFQSKLALLNLKVDEAKKHINKAQEIATDKGLRHLAIMVSNEFDTLLKQIDRWEELIENKLPFDQIIELTQFEQILNRINPQDNQDVSAEEPVLLLILGAGEITLFSHNFTESDINESLVGSFLNAITKFEKDSSSLEGSIDRIVHQDYIILIKTTGQLRFCFIIKGNSYSAIQKFDTFIDSVQASALWGKLLESPNTLENELLPTLERICSDLFIYDEIPVENGQKADTSWKSSVDDTEYVEVPKELLSYKFLLNPVRLSIIKILNTYFRYPAAELRKLLGIPWGTFNDHLEALSKKGFIEFQKEFIKENSRKILYLTSSGSSEYSTLKSILHSVISSK